MAMSNFILTVACIALFVKSGLCQFPLKPCIPKSKCSCVNADGLIDLHPLANHDGTPRFRDIPDPDGKTFYSWNPCYGFDEVDCKNVAVCQIKDRGSTSVSLGNQSSLVFVASSLYGQVYQYTQWGGANNSGNVILTCDQGEEGRVTRRPDGDFGNNFYLELTSKYACPIKINGSTTTHSTSSTTTGRRPTTPAFIGTAKTPPTTMKPMFDINTLSGLMIGTLIMLFIILGAIGLFFVYTVSRFNDIADKSSVINQGYGSQTSVNEKQHLVDNRHNP